MPLQRLAKGPWRVTLQLALAAASGLAIFWPPWRTPALHAAVLLLFFCEAGVSFAEDWKAGVLRATPRELYEKFRSGARRPGSPLALLAVVLGCVAVVLIDW
jgi:hypothetical protein